MRRRTGGFGLPMAALLCVAALAQGNRARAWTKARVQGADAEIELHADGRADVLLRVELKVLGGYLSELAVDGLDPDLELDPQRPPRLTSEQGRLYLPQVKSKPGEPLLLFFPGRRAAPWRGEYLVELFYRTRLVPRASRDAGRDALRVSWTLPAWEVGLENVQIEVKAPPGTRPVAVPEERAHAIEVDFQDGLKTTSIKWRRIRLPQTESWTVAFDVPRRRLAAALAPSTAVDRAEDHPCGEPDRAGFWLAGCIGLLALLKRRLVERACARSSARPVALVPFASRAVRRAAMVSLAIAAGLLFPEHGSLSLGLMCALVCLALNRSFSVDPLPDTGAWGAARKAERAAAARDRLYAWFGASSWMDATTPLGGALLAGAYLLLGLMLWQRGGAESRLWALGTLLATPLFVTGTRLQLPPSAVEALPMLKKAARRLGMNRWLKPNGYVEPVVFRGGPAAVPEARLRLHAAGWLQGLRLPHARRAGVALLAVAVSGSEADSALADALPRADRHADPSAGLTARLAPLQRAKGVIPELLADLLGRPAAGGMVSRRAA
jgi:hypothetical protein